MTSRASGCSSVFESSTSGRLPCRRSRPARIQTDCVEKRRKRKDQVRNNLRRFHERQRSSFNESDTLSTDVFTFAPSLYLLDHQKKAVFEFLGWVYSVSHSPESCSTCRESYHGIHLKGSECERCFNEVGFFSLICSTLSFLCRSAVDIGLWKKTTQILGAFQMPFVMFLKDSPKWRRCWNYHAVQRNLHQSFAIWPSSSKSGRDHFLPSRTKTLPTAEICTHCPSYACH